MDKYWTTRAGTYIFFQVAFAIGHYFAIVDQFIEYKLSFLIKSHFPVPFTSCIRRHPDILVGYLPRPLYNMLLLLILRLICILNNRCEEIGEPVNYFYPNQFDTHDFVLIGHVYDLISVRLSLCGVFLVRFRSGLRSLSWGVWQRSLWF